MEYPKINTLFERNEDFSIDPTRLKHPVYGTIKEWDVTEKVDGTNIRVIYTPGRTATGPEVDCWDQQLGIEPSVRFAGRTDAANTPGDLLQNLAKLFPVEKFTSQFQAPVVLYGEGYGAGIQKVGKLYRPDKSFILFDVLVDGKWWLDTTAVQSIAMALGCDVVPFLGRWTLDKIIDEVRGGILSKVWPEPTTDPFLSEGIVARPLETLFDSRHERVILKLKTKDFVAGKR